MPNLPAKGISRIVETLPSEVRLHALGLLLLLIGLLAIGGLAAVHPTPAVQGSVAFLSVALGVDVSWLLLRLKK